MGGQGKGRLCDIYISRKSSCVIALEQRSAIDRIYVWKILFNNDMLVDNSKLNSKTRRSIEFKPQGYLI